MHASSSTPIQPLICPSCGAQLHLTEAERRAEHVRCPFCGTTLLVRRDSGGVILEALQTVSRDLSHQLGSANQTLQEQLRQQQTHSLAMQIEQARTQYRIIERTPQSHQRKHTLDELYAQLQTLHQEYRRVAGKPYPPAHAAPDHAGGWPPWAYKYIVIGIVACVFLFLIVLFILQVT